MTTTNKKLFITGGHLTPALAVIDELVGRGGFEIVFIGRRGTMEGEKDISREEEIIQAKGLRFLPLTTGRLQRAVDMYSFISFCKIPVGLAQSFLYVWKEKPDAVVSFGGYIALPVVIVAAFMRIPVITHEQTTVPGLANKIIAFFARKICVTFKETIGMFPKEKVIFTGLPVRKELLNPTKVTPLASHIETYPIVYMTGGSTGSVSLNALLFPIVEELTRKYTIIHQTGKLSSKEALRVRDALAASLKERYIIADYFNLSKLAWIMKHALLVIGRSGANTVVEVAMMGKMAFFVPLPWSGGGEQMKNAQWLESNGSAKVIAQKEANPSNVLGMIQKMIKEKKSYLHHAKELSTTIPQDAASRMVDELEAIVR